MKTFLIQVDIILMFANETNVKVNLILIFDNRILEVGVISRNLTILKNEKRLRKMTHKHE